MSTGFYANGKNNIGLGNIDLVNDDIVAVLLDTTQYSVDVTNDEVQSDIPSIAILDEKTLTGKTFSNGIFDADDLVFPSLVNDGRTIGAIALIKDTGANNTSLLICYIDNDVLFPVTPDGGDVTISWDNGTNKIFKL